MKAVHAGFNKAATNPGAISRGSGNNGASNYRYPRSPTLVAGQFMIGLRLVRSESPLERIVGRVGSRVISSPCSNARQGPPMELNVFSSPALFGREHAKNVSGQQMNISDSLVLRNDAVKECAVRHVNSIYSVITEFFPLDLLMAAVLNPPDCQGMQAQSKAEKQ